MFISPLPGRFFTCLSLLRVQHLHQQRLVWRVALHVLEVQEVLSALGHHFQVGKQVQKLSEFVLDTQEGKVY